MNLFEIKNDLRKLFDTIEESDGEITEEIDEKLRITEDNLKDKLSAYVHKINAINSDIDACDTELKRIKRLKDRKKSLVERLSKYVIEAVTEFGNQTSSGNFKYDATTMQLFTRKSKRVNISEIFDDDCKFIANYVEQLSDNKTLDLTDFKEDLLSCAKEQEGLNLSEEDLNAIDAKVTLKCKCTDLVNGTHNSVVQYILRSIGGTIDFDIDKVAIRKDVESGKINFAKIENNTSLIIK